MVDKICVIPVVMILISIGLFAFIILEDDEVLDGPATFSGKVIEMRRIDINSIMIKLDSGKSFEVIKSSEWDFNTFNDSSVYNFWIYGNSYICAYQEIGKDIIEV